MVVDPTVVGPAAVFGALLTNCAYDPLGEIPPCSFAIKVRSAFTVQPASQAEVGLLDAQAPSASMRCANASASSHLNPIDNVSNENAVL